MSEDTAFEVGRLYQPIKAIADTLVASQKDIFVRLPGLIAYYPMGIRNQSGHTVEHSGTGVNLIQQGTCATGYDGNSFAHLGSGTNYLFGASLYGITGLEAWITASLRGLTVGGWFMVDSTPGVDSGLISKDAPAPNRGYALAWAATNAPLFETSSTGAAAVRATGGVGATGVWHFIVGRHIPSTEVAVFMDGDKSTNTTAVAAAINVSPQAFEVGRFFADNTRIIHGKTRDVFVCAAALSDALIEQIRVTSTP